MDSKRFKRFEFVVIKKVTYTVDDNPLMPDREIVEYWNEYDELIYRYDPLDGFGLIMKADCCKDISQLKK